jgi:hypothetical protein
MAKSTGATFENQLIGRCEGAVLVGMGATAVLVLHKDAVAEALPAVDLSGLGSRDKLCAFTVSPTKLAEMVVGFASRAPGAVQRPRGKRKGGGGRKKAPAAANGAAAPEATQQQ